MYSSASVAASGWTMASSEPSRNTTACSNPSKRGWTPSSSGMSGKTAAPRGTWLSGRSLMLAPGDSGNDRELIAVLDRRVEIVEEANILVIEIDVDEALELALVEHALTQPGELPAEVIKDSLHAGACGLDLRLAGGVLPHRCRNLHANSHEASRSKRVREVVLLRVRLCLDRWVSLGNQKQRMHQAQDKCNVNPGNGMCQSA